jgi:hypothetical protein
VKGILELEGKEHPPMLLCFLLLQIDLNQQAFFQKEAQVKQPHNCKHHSSPANVLSLRTLVQRICCKRNLEIRKTEGKEKPYSYLRHLYRSRTHEKKKDGSNTHKWTPNIFTPHLATGNHQQVLPMNNNLCKKSPTEQSPP